MNVVTIDVNVSHEVDNGLSAQERHQIILSENERFLGLVICYEGSEPMTVTFPS